MNVEIGAEAALFPEKEYINGIAIAVLSLVHLHGSLYKSRFSPNIISAHPCFSFHLKVSCESVVFLASYFRLTVHLSILRDYWPPVELLYSVSCTSQKPLLYNASFL
jgi:hypothetical protein